MPVTIKPSELNPSFLKKIEDQYGKIDMERDFFSGNLDTYFKTSKVNKETGGVTHDIIKLPSFVNLYQNLGKARDDAKTLSRNKELRQDKEFQNQADKVADVFNSFRTFFRKNYPDQYSMVKEAIKETSGMGYNTPNAFGKADISQYTSIGYKPVNQKSLRKKSKGIDYVDLHK